MESERLWNYPVHGARDLYDYPIVVCVTWSVPERCEPADWN